MCSDVCTDVERHARKVLSSQQYMGSSNVDGKNFSDAQRSERKAKKAPPVARTKEQSFGYGACKGGESMFFPTCTGRLVFINIA